MRSVNVIGTRIAAAPLPEVVRELDRVVEEGGREYVCFANAHLAATARADEDVAAALGDAGLVLADGMPVAWAAKTERLAGNDVFESLCGRGYRHFFLGSTEQTLEILCSKLVERFPAIEICGMHSPPFGSALFDDVASIAARVNAARPDVVWVGLGAPKQELWMQAARPLLDAPLLLGVGAVFDFAAGTKARAPQWMQRSGLEWLHRLAQEPRRLFRRYLVTNTQFALALLAQRLGRAHGR